MSILGENMSIYTAGFIFKNPLLNMHQWNLNMDCFDTIFKILVLHKNSEVVVSVKESCFVF